MTDHQDFMAREIVTTRILPHGRARIFRAFTDPAQLAQWWGPKGFTNSFDLCEMRVGGLWRFTMQGPDGRTYANECRFVELSEARIVIDHISDPHFTLTVTLEEWDGKTKITWRQLFETGAIRDAVNRFAGPANEENLDRLLAVIG